MRPNDVTRLGPGFTLAEADSLQRIEGNPLDADQRAMFDMFEREGWSSERRLEHIRQRTLQRTRVAAAE